MLVSNVADNLLNGPPRKCHLLLEAICVLDWDLPRHQPCRETHQSGHIYNIDGVCSPEARTMLQSQASGTPIESVYLKFFVPYRLHRSATLSKSYHNLTRRRCFTGTTGVRINRTVPCSVFGRGMFVTAKVRRERRVSSPWSLVRRLRLLALACHWSLPTLTKAPAASPQSVHLQGVVSILIDRCAGLDSKWR